MKNIFYKLIRAHNGSFQFAIIAFLMFMVSCGGKVQLTDEKEVETPKEDDNVQKFVAHITTFDKLNLSDEKINSHENDYSRSSLKMNYRLLYNYSQTEYPRYPRIKEIHYMTLYL